MLADSQWNIFSRKLAQRRIAPGFVTNYVKMCKYYLIVG